MTFITVKHFQVGGIIDSAFMDHKWGSQSSELNLLVLKLRSGRIIIRGPWAEDAQHIAYIHEALVVPPLRAFEAILSGQTEPYTTGNTMSPWDWYNTLPFYIRNRIPSLAPRKGLRRGKHDCEDTPWHFSHHVQHSAITVDSLDFRLKKAYTPPPSPPPPPNRPNQRRRQRQANDPSNHPPPLSENSQEYKAAYLAGHKSGDLKSGRLGMCYMFLPASGNPY
jgi:hypothetical protein